MIDKELAQVVNHLQEAFDVPEFFGELSRGKLKDRESSEILLTAIQQLDNLSRKYPNSPEIPFLAGIALRYIGDEAGFQRQVDLSLEIDPTYLEAVIAKKEGRNYLDPFCYLSINDLFRKPDLLRPASSVFLNVNGARLDQVRDGINIMPICIIKSQRAKFRQLPSTDMDMALGIEVCAVLPDSPGIPDDWKWPLGDSKQLKRVIQPFLDVLAGKKDFTFILAVCPILADDPNDPFFKVMYINLFPISMETYPFDYQPFLGRYEGLRLCNPPHKTVFVFLDEHNTPLLLKSIDLNPIKDDLLNAGAVIKFLPDTPITMSEWRKAVVVHDQHFFLRIAGRDGKTYSIPKFRTGKERDNVIFGLTVRGNEIRAKHEQEASKDRELRYHIFISHSHDDQKIAYALTEWMLELWPSISIFMTSRDQCEIDELIPGLYFLALHASKCVLFLATPSSLKSSYAQIELGAATQLGVNIIGVCANGSTPDDIEADGIRGDFDRVIDLAYEGAETALLDFLGSALNLTIPEKHKVGRLDQLLKMPRYIPDNKHRERVNEGKIPNAQKIADSQELTKEDTLKWLDIVEKHVENKARMAGLCPELLPKETDVRARLIRILMVSDDAKYDELLRPFAALIDDQFCSKVAFQWRYALQQKVPFADKYFKLLQAAQRIVEGS